MKLDHTTIRQIDQCIVQFLNFIAKWFVVANHQIKILFSFVYLAWITASIKESR